MKNLWWFGILFKDGSVQAKRTWGMEDIKAGEKLPGAVKRTESFYAKDKAEALRVAEARLAPKGEAKKEEGVMPPPNLLYTTVFVDPDEIPGRAT